MPVSACCFFDCCVCAAVIYLVDISECPDFNTMYELYDPCTVMFFFRNKVGISSVGMRQLRQTSKMLPIYFLWQTLRCL